MGGMLKVYSKSIQNIAYHCNLFIFQFEILEAKLPARFGLLFPSIRGSAGRRDTPFGLL